MATLLNFRFASARPAALRALALGVGLGVLSAAGAPPAEPSRADEYRVKAGFLFHFAQLVDWPPSADGADLPPLTFCTLGGDAFHGELEAVAAGKSIGGRTVRVLHAKGLQETKACQVLFLSGGERNRLALLVAKLKDVPVLTVGDGDGFAESGGMIGFVLEGHKVRFDINLSAAQHAHLKISSRVLLLARTVIGGRG